MDNRNISAILIATIIVVTLVIGISLYSRFYYANLYGDDINDNWTPIPTLTRAPATITSTPIFQTQKNCTYPSQYWLDKINQNEDWVVEIKIGNKIFSTKDVAALMDSKTEELYKNLFIQVYSTQLNLLSGADAASIFFTLNDAEDWIAKFSPEADISEETAITISNITTTLTNFNTGKMGPGVCSEVKFTPTPTSTSTEIPSLFEPTSTPTPTDTLTPTPIFTATKIPLPTVPSPTWTKRPIVNRPTNTPIPPTNTVFPTAAPTKEPEVTP